SLSELTDLLFKAPEIPRMMKSGRCVPELSGLTVQALPLRAMRFFAAKMIDGRTNAQRAQGQEASLA
ncbi:MAG: hypothetical protein ACKODK_22420, partial [Opitutaceae bacterium]